MNCSVQSIINYFSEWQRGRFIIDIIAQEEDVVCWSNNTH